MRLTKLYSFLALATVALLAIFSVTTPALATKDAWIHAIIVAVFALILPLRARAAKSGKRSALRATGIISSVIFLVNVIEGLIPNFVPVWMRVDMFITAALMLCVISFVIIASKED